MLEMHPSCECCNKDLPADHPGAMICTYECTFCAFCASDVLQGVCPNCGDAFVKRPIRSPRNLANDPAATTRKFRPEKCQKLAKART